MRVEGNNELRMFSLCIGPNRWDEESKIKGEEIKKSKWKYILAVENL